MLAALALLVGGACKGNKAAGESEGKAAPTSGEPLSSQEGASEGGSDASLPERLAPVSSGTFTPAPWLDGATSVAVAKRGDKVWIAAAGVRELRLHAADGTLIRKVTTQGTAHRLMFVDVDGDGTAELLGAWGLGAKTRNATTELKLFRGADLSEVVDIDLGKTTRSQVADITVGSKGDVIIAHFVSKYIVALSRLVPESMSVQPGKRVRMVSGLAVVTRQGGAETVALARVYGDALGDHGLVQIYDSDTLTTLPSTRGARAIRWSDRDQALIVTDGWHRKYAAEARALISKLEPTAQGWKRTVLANVKGRYGYDHLQLADVDGDGVTDAVAAGNGPAVAVSLSADGTSPVVALGGGEAIDAAVFDLDGDGRQEVVVVGTEPGIWSAGARSR